MRDSKSWCEVIHPSAHFGAEGELERQIKRIQSDALREAAEISLEWHLHSKARDARSLYDAILARAKEVEKL